MSDNHSDPSSTGAGRSDTTGPRRLCVCGQELVRINLLVDGEAITMCSCSHCDRRSWHRGDEEIALDGVLADLSSSPTRYRRNLAAR
ncbi:MAG: hypothetical protein IT195_07275 [Microthrixaceae bacterium]|nr:hypothetical protein [Microthrixaceae bacterium]